MKLVTCLDISSFIYNIIPFDIEQHYVLNFVYEALLFSRGSVGVIRLYLLFVVPLRVWVQEVGKYQKEGRDKERGRERKRKRKRRESERDRQTDKDREKQRKREHSQVG